MFWFIFIVVSILLTLDLLWWWRGDAWAKRLPQPRAWRTAWSLFMAVQMLGMLLLMLARPLGLDRTAGLPTGVLIFLFVWHMLVLPGTLVVALLGGVGWSVARLAGLLMGGARSPDPEPIAIPQPHGRSLTRRQFLAATAVTVPPLVTVIGSVWAVPQLSSFRIRRLTIPLRSLPPELDGLTIAQVADVHVGDFTYGKTLDDIVEATNQLEPDLVLLTGDLINRRHADLPAALDMVRRLDPKHGLYMCEGNHDLFEGRGSFGDRVRAAGVPLLVDSSHIIHIGANPVQIMGLQWGPRRHGGDEVINQSIDRLLTQRRPDAFGILLAHHPHAFDRAADVGIPLTFAGHTHGGQLHLTPGIGFGPAMFRYWSGLYRKHDGSALVVSNGVGNWFPLRVNAPAEIIHVTLRRQA